MLRTTSVQLDTELLRECIIKLLRINIYIADKNLMSRVHTAAGQVYGHILILNLEREIRLCESYLL